MKSIKLAMGETLFVTSEAQQYAEITANQISDSECELVKKFYFYASIKNVVRSKQAIKDGLVEIALQEYAAEDSSDDDFVTIRKEEFVARNRAELEELFAILGNRAKRKDAERMKNLAILSLNDKEIVELDKLIYDEQASRHRHTWQMDCDTKPQYFAEDNPNYAALMDRLKQCALTAFMFSPCEWRMPSCKAAHKYINALRTLVYAPVELSGDDVFDVIKSAHQRVFNT